MSEFEKRFEPIGPTGIKDIDKIIRICHTQNKIGWLEALKWVFNSNLCGGYSAKRIEQEIEELEKERNKNGRVPNNN